MSACAAPVAGGHPWRKTPEVIAAIKAALQYDPITGVRWTHRTTDKIATELATLGIQVCPRTAARILKGLNYRLRVNHKRVSAGSAPDRDQQFAYIAEQRAQFAHRGPPIVSIDTKKRELVGNFKNAGSVWAQTPQAVNDHYFRSQADGIAIPYGVYDLCANRGFVVVGTSHDTADFAADNLLRWWQSGGLERYPGASELLVLADSGGSNAPPRPLLQVCPQPRLVDPTSSGLPSVTTPAVPPSGTRSTIACSARSARTGPAIRCAATRPSSITSAPPPPRPDYGCTPSSLSRSTRGAST